MANISSMNYKTPVHKMHTPVNPTASYSGGSVGFGLATMYFVSLLTVVWGAKNFLMI